MSLEDLGIRTPQDVIDYISDGSGRQPKIIESSPEEVRDTNIRAYMRHSIRQMVEEYDVTPEYVQKLVSEIKYKR